MTTTSDEFVRENHKTNNEIICGMLQDNYNRNFDISSIWNFEESIENDEIMSGDILYFDFVDGKVSLGIAQSNRKFIHFTNHGTTESDFKSNTWSNRFIGTSRIIKENTYEY